MKFSYDKEENKEMQMLYLRDMSTDSSIPKASSVDFWFWYLGVWLGIKWSAWTRQVFKLWRMFMATLLGSWIDALSLFFGFVQNQNKIENWKIILESTQ